MSGRKYPPGQNPWVSLIANGFILVGLLIMLFALAIVVLAAVL